MMKKFGRKRDLNHGPENYYVRFRHPINTTTKHWRQGTGRFVPRRFTPWTGDFVLSPI